MGAMRLTHPVQLATLPMLAAAAGGIVTEVIALRLLYRRQNDDLNMQGAFWHIAQTFVGSLIIVVSALVVRYTGFLAIDPLLGMAFGLVLFWVSWKILRETLHILLQGTPRDLDLPAVLSAMSAVPGVVGVHHVHAWTLTSGRAMFSAHVRVADMARDGDSVLQAVSALLRERFRVYFSTIQVETHCTLESEPAAAIDAVRAAPPGR